MHLPHGTIYSRESEPATRRRHTSVLCMVIMLLVAAAVGLAPRAAAEGAQIDLGPASVVVSGGLELQTQFADGVLLGHSLRCPDLQVTLTADIPVGSVFAGLASFKWGPGRSGSLVMSGEAGPMPVMGYRLNIGMSDYIRFIGLMEREDNRRLIGQRLEYSPNSRLTLGVSETAVVSGAASNLLCWPFPGLPIYAIQHVLTQADSRQDNLINMNLGLDFSVRIADTEVYGELFVDDAQGNPSDRSKVPDWFGGLIGIDAPEFFGLPWLGVNLEYVGITNYVYSHRNHVNNYTYHDIALGHPLGPDADSLILTFTFRPADRVRISLKGAAERHGEGRLGRSWTPDDGRNNIFLSGIVEETAKVGTALEYALSDAIALKWTAGYALKDNYNNVEGAQWKGWDCGITVRVKF